MNLFPIFLKRELNKFLFYLFLKIWMHVIFLFETPSYFICLHGKNIKKVLMLMKIIFINSKWKQSSMKMYSYLLKEQVSRMTDRPIGRPTDRPTDRQTGWPGRPDRADLAGRAGQAGWAELVSNRTWDFQVLEGLARRDETIDLGGSGCIFWIACVGEYMTGQIDQGIFRGNVKETAVRQCFKK